MDFEKGGQNAINRVMEAYGFRFRQQLCEHFEIPKSTLATWYKQDLLPGTMVIRCALETKASLSWLVTGEGAMFEHTRTDINQIDKYKIDGTELLKAGYMMFDSLILPSNLKKPFVISEQDKTYVLDSGITEREDGEWLVCIEGKYSIRELAFIPVKKVRVLGGGVPFDCGVDEIQIVAKVMGVFIRT
ncbi:MAG: phage repressor protein CI [Hafnia alvei]|uniref:phage repressor protein CI n=1 Tax=Hafnia alvei TaxID=569 RepID=UPI003F93BEDE